MYIILQPRIKYKIIYFREEYILFSRFRSSLTLLLIQHIGKHLIDNFIIPMHGYNQPESLLNMKNVRITNYFIIFFYKLQI